MGRLDSDGKAIECSPLETVPTRTAVPVHGRLVSRHATAPTPKQPYSVQASISCRSANNASLGPWWSPIRA